MEIWSSLAAVLAEARARINCDVSDIAALAITNQRETTLIWDRKTSKPIYNAIGWQCRRTAGYCDALRASGFGNIIRERTGLIADAYFSGPKIRWILDNVPGARERSRAGELAFGTVDSWLVWNLTRGRKHVTDYSNASRTMLFDIRRLDWDDEILAELDIPRALLPEAGPSSHIHALTDPEFLGGEVAVAGIAGDQQAALFGQCCFEPGMVKNTYGTGCFILMHTGQDAIRSENGLLTTIAWGIGDKVEYAIEGSVFIAGAAVQWLRDGLGIIADAAESGALAAGAGDTNGVYFVPAFTGLGAPHWDPHARGGIFGLTRGVSRSHIVRAALESIAYQSADVIRAMESDAGTRLKELRVDGGASANDFLMQFQADILGARIVRPAVIESTALGAARLAGLAVGLYANQDEIAKNAIDGKVFRPGKNGEEMRRLVSGWRRAVSCSLGWDKP
jgi:glycerol kinase